MSGERERDEDQAGQPPHRSGRGARRVPRGRRLGKGAVGAGEPRRVRRGEWRAGPQSGPSRPRPSGSAGDGGGDFSERQLEHERGAALGRVFDAQVAALGEEDLARHGQAEARALARRLGREEPVEDLLLDRARDAGAVVHEPDLDGPLEAPGLHRDRGPFLRRIHRLPGVHQQVDEHLAETVRVGLDLGQLGVEGGDQLDAGDGALGPLQVHRAPQDVVEVDRLERRRRRARHLEQLAHQALGPGGRLDDVPGSLAALLVGRVLLDELGEGGHGGERRVDVVDHAGHALPDGGEALGLHQVLAGLRHLRLEDPHRGRPVLTGERQPELAAESFQDVEVLRGQDQQGIVPPEQERAPGWRLERADRDEQELGGQECVSRDVALERRLGDPPGLADREGRAHLGQEGQSDPAQRRGVLGASARGPFPDGREPTVLGRPEERQHHRRAERLAESRHQLEERRLRRPVAREGIGDRQQRLERQRPGLNGLQQVRLVDREGGGVGEEAEDGEVLGRELRVGPGQAVDVQHADHPFFHEEGHRDRRLDPSALGLELLEAREVVTLVEEQRLSLARDPSGDALADLRAPEPDRDVLAGLARRDHAQRVALDQHQRGLVRVQAIGGAVHDVAEQLARVDLLGEDAGGDRLDPQDVLQAENGLAAGPGLGGALRTHRGVGGGGGPGGVRCVGGGGSAALGRPAAARKEPLHPAHRRLVTPRLIRNDRPSPRLPVAVCLSLPRSPAGFQQYYRSGRRSVSIQAKTLGGLGPACYGGRAIRAVSGRAGAEWPRRQFQFGMQSDGGTAMRGKALAVLLLAALIGAGCSAATLKAQKDDSWNWVPKSLPDVGDPGGGGYGHPFRIAGFLVHPLGVALDYVIVRPFYLMGGIAPEWFGFTAEDGQRYHQHHPELVVPRNAPERF